MKKKKLRKLQVSKTGVASVVGTGIGSIVGTKAIRLTLRDIVGDRVRALSLSEAKAGGDIKLNIGGKLEGDLFNDGYRLVCSSGDLRFKPGDVDAIDLNQDGVHNIILKRSFIA